MNGAVLNEAIIPKKWIVLSTLKFTKILTNAKNHDIVSRTVHVTTIAFSLHIR